GTLLHGSAFPLWPFVVPAQPENARPKTRACRTHVSFMEAPLERFRQPGLHSEAANPEMTWTWRSAFADLACWRASYAPLARLDNGLRTYGKKRARPVQEADSFSRTT